jgi:magnesium chelatase family protein
VLAKVLSSAVLGIDAYRVEVEVDISSGLPSFSTVGLPEASVKESKERVKSAITNSGYRFPDDRITVNLAPADIKKEGTGFDLPIALGILAATGFVPRSGSPAIWCWASFRWTAASSRCGGRCRWPWRRARPAIRRSSSL